MDVQKNYALMNTVNSFSLSLQDCGYAVLDDQWCCQQTCSPYNKLYLVESGESILYTDTQTVMMKPGMAYLIPAGRAYGYRCDERMTKLYFHVHLTKNDGTDLFQSFGRIIEIPLDPECFSALMTHYSGSSYTDALTVREFLYRIINAFDAEYAVAQGTGPRRSAHVTETMLYVQNNISASLQVETLAQARFVSKTYLEKLFRKEMGLSLGQYIDEVLMRTAKWWLEQTNHSVAEVSRILGYQDPYYFSRRFKQLCGMTPLQYRKTRRPGNLE